MGLTVPTLLQQVSVDTDDVSPTSSGVNQRFHRRGSILGPPKAVPCGRVRGHPHPEKFEIQVLGNPSPGVFSCLLVFLSQNATLITILQFL